MPNDEKAPALLLGMRLEQWVEGNFDKLKIDPTRWPNNSDPGKDPIKRAGEITRGTCQVGWGMGSIVPHKEPNTIAGEIQNNTGEKLAVCQKHLNFVKDGYTVGWTII